jgi:hypothetical protein
VRLPLSGIPKAPQAKLKGSNEAASGLTMLAMTQPFEIVSPGQ